MFKCGFCEKTTEPGEKKAMRAVELREKAYSAPYHEKKSREGVVEVRGHSGRGFEIARESASCVACTKIPVVPKVHHMSDSA